MKNQFGFLALATVLAGTSLQTNAASTPEQQCQAAKNKVAGKYAACQQNAERTRALTGDEMKFTDASTKCASKFVDAWQKAISKATDAGAVCLDAPLTSASFATPIANHAENVAAGLAGAGLVESCAFVAPPPVAVPTAAQVKCRGAKNKAAGGYASCLQGAERSLVLSADMTKYAEALTKCITKFNESWQKAIDKATDAGATCLDAPLTALNFKNVIEQHSSIVKQALAGNGLAVGCAPVAVEETIEAYRGYAITFSPLNNDTDFDNLGNGNAGLTITGIGSPPAGQGTTFQMGTSVGYVPDPVFVGTTSFSYFIEDESGLGDTGTVFVTTSHCGDGVQQIGWEYCDDADLDETDGCTTKCKTGAICTAAQYPTLPYPALPLAKFVVDPNSGHCYVGTTQSQSWHAAAALCDGNGGYLAVPDTFEENYSYVAVAKPDSAPWAWIGVSDVVEEGTFFSETGLLADVEFETQWAAGEPNNAGDADCVHLYPGNTWNDLACSSSVPQFVCEFEP